MPLPTTGRIAVLQLDLQAAIRSRDYLSNLARTYRGLAAEQDSSRNKVAYDLASVQLRMQADGMARVVVTLEDQIAAVSAEIAGEQSEAYHSAPVQLARIQAGQRAVLSADQHAAVDETFGYVARAAA